jgi:2-oxoglutarate ferredoxin oxidoreductase subunit alpha
MRVQMVDKRFRKVKKLELELQEPDFIGDESFDTLLLGWGSTYGAIKEAVATLNRRSAGKFGALVFGDVYPLPVKRLTEKARQARHIINVEQNATGQFAELVREKTGIVCTASILRYDGRQISGEQIAERVVKGEGK